MIIPSNQELAQTQNAVRVIYTYSAQRLKAGIGGPEVESELRNRGLDEQSVSMIIDDLLEVQNASPANNGQRDMTRGALWCSGGLLVTLLTYAAAASNGGGIYLVAWGAIIFGAIQFLQGLVQLQRAKARPLDADATEAAADTRYIIVNNSPQRGHWLDLAARLSAMSKG